MSEYSLCRAQDDISVKAKTARKGLREGFIFIRSDYSEHPDFGDVTGSDGASLLAKTCDDDRGVAADYREGEFVHAALDRCH